MNEIDGYDGREPMVAGVNRRKKATKWLGFAKDVAETGLDIFDKVKSRVGGVNRRKKATKWLGFAKEVADTGLDLFDKVKSKVGGAKKSSPWIMHVKQYCAKHGCSYKEGLKLASPSYKKMN